MNDTTVYRHRFTGECLTGVELDPSGSGYVPTHWETVREVREPDQVGRMFPGDGAGIPTDEERQQADAVVGFAIPRTRDVTNLFANPATNRAFIRSQIRRWCARTGRDWLTGAL